MRKTKQKKKYHIQVKSVVAWCSVNRLKWTSNRGGKSLISRFATRIQNAKRDWLVCFCCCCFFSLNLFFFFCIFYKLMWQGQKHAIITWFINTFSIKHSCHKRRWLMSHNENALQLLTNFKLIAWLTKIESHTQTFIVNDNKSSWKVEKKKNNTIS